MPRSPIYEKLRHKNDSTTEYHTPHFCFVPSWQNIDIRIQRTGIERLVVPEIQFVIKTTAKNKLWPKFTSYHRMSDQI